MVEGLSHEDIDQIYEESVKMLPHYGWPSWPPKEVPQPENWWEKEIAIFPSSKRFLYQPPNRNVLELTGSPQSGKDTLLKVDDP